MHVIIARFSDNGTMDDRITLQSGTGDKRKLVVKLSEFEDFLEFEKRVATEFGREPGVSRSRNVIPQAVGRVAAGTTTISTLMTMNEVP